MRFGFFPGERLSAAPPPRGYGVAVVRAGGLEETAYCSLREWSLDDYSAHWREAASRALSAPEPVVFCSDLTRRGVGVLVAFPERHGWRLEQLIMRRGSITLDGLRVFASPEVLTPCEGASSWRVERAEIEGFLQAA